MNKEPTNAQQIETQQALRLGIPPGARTYVGTSKNSVQEAFEDAHNQIHRHGADTFINSYVLQWGKRSGGLVGISEYYVEVIGYES